MRSTMLVGAKRFNVPGAVSLGILPRVAEMILSVSGVGCLVTFRKTDHGRKPVTSDSGNSSSSADVSSVSSEGGVCGEGLAIPFVGSDSRTYVDRLRRKPASPGFQNCVDKLISSLKSRAVQSLRPDLEDSLDRSRSREACREF